jgi:hypothetical protein
MSITWKERGPNQSVANLPAPVSVFRNPRYRSTESAKKPWRVSIFGACQHDLGWFDNAEEAQASAEKELAKKVRALAKKLGLYEEA